MIAGERFLKGHFLERLHNEKNFVLFKISKLVTYFYKETIIYPFVVTEDTKKGVKLLNEHYTDILTHVQETGYSRL